MADHRVKCTECGQVGTRLDRYDAYACKACDRWLERQCLDNRCTQCPQRPERPSGAPTEVWTDPWN